MRQALGEYDDRDDGYGLIGDERHQAEEVPRRDRRFPMVLLAVFAMALFSGGLWFAYVQGTRHPAASAHGDGVPLLRADERPTKVKPDQPGGMTIPDQNVSLYNEKAGGPPVEKLLPPPEQPLPRPAAPPKEAAEPAAAPQVAPSAVTWPAPNAATAAGQPVPKGIASAASATAPKAPPPAKQPAATPASPAAPAAAKAGPVQIRLGSLRSPEAARDEWAKLKRENADLLGSLSAVAVKADLGEKGIYYRIQAGSLADAAAAERLCGELKRRNLGCILAR